MILVACSKNAQVLQLLTSTNQSASTNQDGSITISKTELHLLYGNMHTLSPHKLEGWPTAKDQSRAADSNGRSN